jgi:PAS domain-containing protein
MKISWIGLFACYVASALYALWRWRFAGAPVTFVWIGGLGLILWLYLTIRLVTFRRRLTNFAKRLLDGNYETGITTTRQLHDEVRLLADLMNKVVDRLRLYDMIRAERVALSTRARDIMFENMKEAVVLADVDKRLFQFSPAARALFGVEQETMTFDSIEKQEENRQFTRFFKDAVERDKVSMETRLAITLPIRGISKEVAAKIVPVKDREEKVKLALIFLK